MIEVEGLVRRLGKTLVLDELSFTARSGEITGFLGPNGAGKTTTMRVLSTLLAPHGGRVAIAGFDLNSHPHEVRRRLGLVTEEAGLLDRLTVREQLTFWGRAHGLDDNTLTERVSMLQDLLELGGFMDERTGRLSKGTRQKAAVARALVHDPPVLLLDEPTANLDVVSTSAILGLLSEPQVRSGKTVLLATHRLEEAAAYADRVVGIARGRTVVSGTPEEIARQAGTERFEEGFLRLIGRVEMSKEAG
ncbi:MAG TPA: ABC transporter ATP-binding protein [Actinomycetota bacterium]|nr:ABC transporter ATP-binding protein [Actinomycetota bacterium]